MDKQPWAARRWWTRGCPFCGGDCCESLDDRGWATCMLCGRDTEIPVLQANIRRSRIPVEAAP